MPRRGRHLCTEATAHVKGEKESFQEATEKFVCAGMEMERTTGKEPKGLTEAKMTLLQIAFVRDFDLYFGDNENGCK